MRKIILLFLSLSVKASLSAQSITITGNVTDQYGYGLAGLKIDLYSSPYVYTTYSSASGIFSFHNVTDVDEEQIPSSYSVSNNYPNPFNPRTRMAITLSKDSEVRVNIYNLLGQKVRDEINQYFNAGVNFLDLEMNGLSNGFYVAEIMLDGKYTFTKKLMLLYGSQHLSNSTGSAYLKSEFITKKSLSILIIDSLVVADSTDNRTVFTNISLPSDTGNYFDIGTFILQGPPLGPPTLLSPENGAADITISPILIWNSVKDAISYHIRIADNDQLYNSNFYATNDTSIQITNLAKLTKYYWCVSADNYSPSGTTGYSSLWSFTTEGAPPCPGIPTIIYSGKTYNTVQIGNQCWLKENLDIGIQLQAGEVPTNNGKIEKYCYDNDPNNCVQYGGLYQWNEAMQYGVTEGAKGICPEGWHIPTRVEFQTLVTSVTNDGNTLKAIGQGSGFGAGTNTSGFTGLLCGFRAPINTFLDLNYSADFWSSSKIDDTYNYYLAFYRDSGGIMIGSNPNKTGYSIRCIKD